jgi:hypothetical protein
MACSSHFVYIALTLYDLRMQCTLVINFVTPFYLQGLLQAELITLVTLAKRV